MKVLLTGGLGYIGSHTAVELVAAGHQPVLLDNLCNAQLGTLDRLCQITSSKLRLVVGDVRDEGLVRGLLDECQIEAVIHFAGLKAVGESVIQPLRYYDTNIAGTIALLKSMLEVGVSTLVFSSSATVYGVPDYLPLDEGHPLGATNPYGRTKLHIEQMLDDVSASGAAWRIAKLRYFNPVGAHHTALIGDDPNGVPNNLMPYIARVAAGRLPELQVFGADYDTQDGTGVRDYLHVTDLARGHVAALEFLQQRTGVHAFNLGTGRGTSVLQMVKAFEHASGKTIKYAIKPRRDGDVAACFADVEKARQELMWSTQLDLEAMCESAWRFVQASH